MAVPTRPYDALYDPLLTVSGARDHYRSQSHAGAFSLKRVGDFNNWTSDLPHYPLSTYQFKPESKVPPFVSREFRPHVQDRRDQWGRSRSVMVEGRHRTKYFHRPFFLPHALPVIMAPPKPPPPEVDAVPAASGKGEFSEPLVEDGLRTIGTQSVYRESEAQTYPWEPQSTVPRERPLKQRVHEAQHHCSGPEVQYLRHLTFADGLPPGQTEVDHVEKLREKRAFESSLPPLNDLERLPLRLKMIEEWEAREWEERDQEIWSVQKERLELLQQALQVREEEHEEEAAARAVQLKDRVLAEKQPQFTQIQRQRVKAMRHFVEARKYAEKHRKLQLPTKVQQYASYGSSVYAPLQREGCFPESKPAGKEIETESFMPVSLAGLDALEDALPARVREPQTSQILSANKVPLTQSREQQQVQKDLANIHDLLQRDKAENGRGFGACWPCPVASPEEVQGKKKKTRPVSFRNAERPLTPEVEQPPENEDRMAAVLLLQRLLRGRAIQNDMYEGKTMRQDLVQELRLQELLLPVQRPEHHAEAVVLADQLLGAAFFKATGSAGMDYEYALGSSAAPTAAATAPAEAAQADVATAGTTEPGEPAAVESATAATAGPPPVEGGEGSQPEAGEAGPSAESETTAEDAAQAGRDSGGPDAGSAEEELSPDAGSAEEALSPDAGSAEEALKLLEGEGAVPGEDLGASVKVDLVAQEDETLSLSLTLPREELTATVKLDLAAREDDTLSLSLTPSRP